MGTDFPQVMQSWALLEPLQKEENQTQQHTEDLGGQNPPESVCKP